MIIDYDVVAQAGYADFAESVNQKIRMGWQPHGSMQVVQAFLEEGKTRRPIYVQPMVKIEQIVVTTKARDGAW